MVVFIKFVFSSDFKSVVEIVKFFIDYVIFFEFGSKERSYELKM